VAFDLDKEESLTNGEDEEDSSYYIFEDEKVDYDMVRHLMLDQKCKY